MAEALSVDQMQIWAISPRVNSLENNGAGIVDSGEISELELAVP